MRKYNTIKGSKFNIFIKECFNELTRQEKPKREVIYSKKYIAKLPDDVKKTFKVTEDKNNYYFTEK